MSSKTNATGQANASARRPSRRMACVYVPDVLFQWMIQRQPDCASLPLAIVEDERPSSPLLLTNPLARQAGLRTGTRYIEALALCPQLRVGCVSSPQRAEINETLARLLGQFSPQVAPHKSHLGTFHLDAAGLIGLFNNYDEWAVMLATELAQAGYNCTLAVGFTRFGTSAISRALATGSYLVVASPEQEDQQARQVELTQLDIPLRMLEGLAELGLTTVDQLLTLSPESVLDRFGTEAFRFQREARQELWDPLQPLSEETVWEAEMALEYTEGDRERLLFLTKRLLDGLLLGLSRQRLGVRRVHLELKLYDESSVNESVSTSQPSLDAMRILDLLRLRFEASTQELAVTDLKLWVEPVDCPHEQLELFEIASRRELQAANRALDRVRADLGAENVVRAALAPGHMPQAQFAWQPLERLEGRPRATDTQQLHLIRRLLPHPRRLAAPAPGNLLAGPFRLAGNWWRAPVERDYYYVQEREEIGWAFYDVRKQRWYQQGRLE